MRALLLILIASSALGQGRFDRFNQRTDQGRSTRGFEQSSYAFFEFAPASGAGMGTACACTTPTGAKGEALTLTRAGDATCSKQGLATTGINNGDLVVCAGDQPRVESSGGVLGLRVEGARTNITIRSQEIDNAAWLDSTSGVLGPTITTNAGTAPDGTLTAERLVYPATVATQYSVRYQSIPGCNSNTCSYSVYVRGFSGSGTLDLCSWGTAGTPGTGCVTCSYVSTSWTYCSVTHTNTTPSFILFGSDSSGARPTHPSEDVLVWGAQSEVAAYPTSYIPTVAAAGARNADIAYFSLSGPGLSVGSMAATVQTAPSASFPYILTASAANPPPGSGFDQFALYSNGTSGSTWSCFVGANAAVYATGSVAPGAGTSRRGWCSAGGVGGVVNGAMDGNSMTASGTIAGPFAAENFLFVGSINNALTAVDSVVSRVCRDPSPSRCR